MGLHSRHLSLLVGCWLAFAVGGCGEEAETEQPHDVVPYGDMLGASGSSIVLRALSSHPPRFGQTYDSVADELSDTDCIDYDTLSTLSSGRIDATYDLVIVKSYQDIQNHLGVSYQTSAGVGMFKETASYSVASDFHFTSNKVLAIFVAEVLGPTQQLINPTIKPALRVGYNNFDDFYLGSPCGDRYVAAIQSGARMAMTLEITTGSYEEKLAVEAELQQKAVAFKASGSISNELKSTLSRYRSELHVEIVGAPSCNFGMPANSLDGFMSKLQSFTADIHACLGFDATTNGYDLNNFDVTRSPYRVTLMPLPDPWNTGSLPYPANMRTRIEWYQRWKTLELDIGYMVARPDQFDLAGRPDYDTSAKLLAAANQVRTKIAGLLGEINDCAVDPEACAAQPDPASDPSTMEGALPNRKPFQPQTCAAYKTIYRNMSFPDAPYLLYLGGDPEKAYEVYCYGMHTASPLEYLELPNSSLPGSPRYNYTHKRQRQYDSAGVLRVIENNTFAWTKLRVVPHPSHLDVDLRDRQFGAAASQGASTAAFGSPWGCSGGSASVVESKANIDLTGLHFSFDPAVTWTAGGYLGRGKAVLSNDRKSAELAGDGSCGGWVPATGIQLVWSP